MELVDSEDVDFETIDLDCVDYMDAIMVSCRRMSAAMGPGGSPTFHEFSDCYARSLQILLRSTIASMPRRPFRRVLYRFAHLLHVVCVIGIHTDQRDAQRRGAKKYTRRDT